MTLSTTPNRISYAGNSVATVFAFPYYFIKEEDLVVILKNNTTGVEVTQIITTNYSITGEGEQAGGSVTMVVAPPTGYTLTILRDPVPTQEVDLVENDKLPAETVERELDLLTMILQRHADLLDRSFVLTDGFALPFDVRLPPLLPADTSIVVNSTGDAFTTGPSITDISAAAANAAAAAASAAAALVSETAADASATAAAASAAAALASETAADASATAAAASAAAAATSETNAATSETNAATSASNAATSETNAATSETNAAASAVAAAASAAVAAGGGGGGSLRWVEATSSPTPNVNDAFMEVYDYQSFAASGQAQSLYALIKVPNGYTAGNQAKLRGFFFSADAAGTVLMQTVATLIRAGVDLYSTTTNQRTSTNAAVTLSAGTVNELQAVLYDLSDGSGQINGVAIAAGDVIKVELKRGTDTATSDVSVPVYAMEGNFS